TYSQEITIKNTLNIERIDELVCIPITKIDTRVLNKELTPIIYDNNSRAIPFQLEDINDDGEWDQLIFVTNFKPGEVKKIHYNVIEKSKTPSFQKATDIHFGVGNSRANISEVQYYNRINDPRLAPQKKIFQMEGPAWENDKVGFRMYFDPRNGIDIFGKTTSNLTLSTVGILGDYHTKESWGMDILKVGNSLGAGAIAIQLKDSLYRITGKNGAAFKVIEEGPIKASFEINYVNDKIHKIPIQTKHKVSIYKGQWYYKSEIYLSGITSEMKLVAGIANLKPNTMHIKKGEDNVSMYSFGKQSENGDHLGMALILNKDVYYTHGTIQKKETGITNTHYVVFNSENKIPLSYYFLSGWEASDSKFKSEEGFSKEIETILQKLANPIVVEYE
ncbi:DUF4861 domain-containing protein, partial [Aquimarina sp. BL5]